MTKRRLLLVLAVLVLINLVMVNQIWLSASAGEASTLIELAGTKVSNLVSPILVLVALSVFVASYLNGKAVAILLLVEASLVAFAALPLAPNLTNPAASIAASGQIEKITGLTGTTSELTAQLSEINVSPSFAISIAALFSLAFWMLLTGFFAWRWRRVGRVSKSTDAKTSTKEKGKKVAKSSFDLWDSQR